MGIIVNVVGRVWVLLEVLKTLFILLYNPLLFITIFSQSSFSNSSCKFARLIITVINNVILYIFVDRDFGFCAAVLYTSNCKFVTYGLIINGLLEAFDSCSGRYSVRWRVDNLVFVVKEMLVFRVAVFVVVFVAVFIAI